MKVSVSALVKLVGWTLLLANSAAVVPRAIAANEPAANQVIPGGIRIAANFAGSDCGEKINTASANLDDAAGEIWVDNSCGMSWVTEIQLPQQHVLRFSQGGVYTVSAPIRLGHLVGSGFGAPHLSGQAPTVIRQADAADLPFILRVGTHAGSITDVEVDGNMSNNFLSQDGIRVRARGVAITNVYVHDARRHGIYTNGWTVLGDEAGVLKIHKSVSAKNGGDGIRFEDAQDTFISMSEFEDNAGYGIALFNANAARIEHSDIAQNGKYGIYATGDFDRLGSSYLLIVGNQFGSGKDTDLYIDGWDGTGYVSVANVITGNMFYSGNLRVPGESDAIYLRDSYANTITGNVFNSNGQHEYRYAVNFETTGRTLYDTVSGNSFIGQFGLSALKPSRHTVVMGNTGGPNYIYDDLTVAGALMFGGSFGQKGLPYFRHNTGAATSGVTGDLFGIANAGVAYLAQMDKSGNLGVAGVLKSTGVVSSADISPVSSNTHNLGAAGSNWGCLYYNSGTLGTCASDMHLKESITDLGFTDPLMQVAALRPRAYRFKTDTSQAVYHGLIAQEVEDLAPALVSTGDDGSKAVRYGDLQWLMLSAVKELAVSFKELFSAFRMDANKPTGITLYDTATGEANCVQVNAGELVRLAGKCE